MKYDFKCKECGHTFEVESTISNRNVPTTHPCPECDQNDTVERYYNAFPEAPHPSQNLTSIKVPRHYSDRMQRIRNKHNPTMEVRGQ